VQVLNLAEHSLAGEKGEAPLDQSGEKSLTIRSSVVAWYRIAVHPGPETFRGFRSEERSLSLL
jgi:hypothetical protein